MHQKHPKSLITDGDAAMAGAIDIVMPDADHRLCSWHIEQNALKRFCGLKLNDFRKLIYYAMEESEFESLWTEFRDTHNIKEDNLWMNRMYELRHKWAAMFIRGRRFLGMQSNQRSEGMNSRLHSHLDRKMSLVDLVEHYEFYLSRIRRNEIENDAKALLSREFTKICADFLEKSAAEIFTPKICKKVRFQINKASHWSVT
jgi:zinc finger SWIM domain-containing protein 3